MPAKKTYNLGAKGGTGEVDLTVPSGALCRVRRPGPQGLIKMGLLDSLDSLTGLVKLKHFDRVDGRAGLEESQNAIKEFAANSTAVQAGFDLVDKVVVGVVVAPVILAVPLGQDGKELPEPERDQSAIYVDSVDLDDKMFILQFVVGGTADLAAFRRERDQLMGNVSDLQDVQLPA